MKAIKPVRYYDSRGFLTGYADATYSFVCERNDEGSMIGYANSKGAKSGTLAN